MTKKINIILILIFLIYGCSNQTVENYDSEQNSKIDFPSKNIGNYISADYLDELKKSGSTKKAQEKSTLSTVQIINKEPDIVISTTWGFHEGGEIGECEMTSQDDAIMLEELSNDTIFKIDMSKNNEITIYNGTKSYKLQQYNNSNKRGYSELVNSIILSGKFYFNNKEIKFLKEGKILGLDSITEYSFHEDYYDAGMQFDMIYLYDVNNNEEVYGYEIDDKKFEIFRLGCLERDTVNDYCLVRSKENVIFNFDRKK